MRVCLIAAKIAGEGGESSDRMRAGVRNRCAAGRLTAIIWRQRLRDRTALGVAAAGCRAHTSLASLSMHQDSSARKRRTANLPTSGKVVRLSPVGLADARGLPPGERSS